MDKTIVVLHGYSDGLDSFSSLAEFLRGNGFSVQPIFLGDYITL